MQVHITKYRATAMWTWDVDEAGGKKRETRSKNNFSRGDKRPRRAGGTGANEMKSDDDDEDGDEEEETEDDDEEDEVDADLPTTGLNTAGEDLAGSEEGICGICRQPFDATCPNCKYAGEDCPPVFGHCHVFHMHCIEKWLEASVAQGKPHCPLCRSEWQYRAD